MYSDRKFDELLGKVEENNRILKKIQRTARWARFFTLLRWLVVIGAATGLYYLLQPFFDQAKEVWPQLQVIWENVGSFLPGSNSTTTPN